MDQEYCYSPTLLSSDSSQVRLSRPNQATKNGATERIGWLTLAKAEDILGEIYIKNIATIAIDMTEDSVILFWQYKLVP